MPDNKNIKGDLPAIFKKVSAEIDAVTELRVREAMHRVERRAKQNLTDVEKVDRGFLRNSIDTRVRNKGSQIEGVVFAGAKHARWVHEGRLGTKSTPPGVNTATAATAAFPNLGAIKKWVKRKNLKLAVSGRKTKGKNKGSAKAAKSKDVDKAAYAIAISIKERGIAPTPFLRAAFKSEIVDFKKKLLASINKIVIPGK